MSLRSPSSPETSRRSSGQLRDGMVGKGRPGAAARSVSWPTLARRRARAPAALGRTAVGKSRQSWFAPLRARVLAGCALLILLLVVGGCGDHPEALLVGRWQESGWEYEKPATKAQAEAQWIEGLALPEFSERLVVHHEAEYWDFRPDGRLVIAKRDGTQLVAHWRLKGRGHVLTVSSPEEGFEVYDVKGLDRDELVLNFDVGMEVRGIARLTFKRVTDNTALREARRAPLSFVSPGH